MAVQFKRAKRAERRPTPPLDAAGLKSLALAYAARYATTESRLAHYLRRKVRERGWAEADTEPDIAGIVERLAGLNYVDDCEYARAKSEGLKRRGMGPARIRASLDAAGIDREIGRAAAEMSPEQQLEGARAFCERRRFTMSNDPKQERRQFAALARAGYGFEIARAALAGLTPDRR